MDTIKQVAILSRITTRDEAGTHFSALYDDADLDSLVADGYLHIERPTHGATGIPYSVEFATCTVTADGMALIDANPEYTAQVEVNVRFREQDDEQERDLGR